VKGNPVTYDLAVLDKWYFANESHYAK